ncbi:MAG: transglutaminase protein [Edaphobacter sp.]|nr:transglutaminase protein [Edaphobacter sp.]
MIGCIVLLRRIHRLLFVSAVLLHAVVPAFAKQDSVPEWVRTAAAQKLPSYSPETSAVILFEDTTYSVAFDGTATEHYRSVVKILRPQGREDAVVAVPFDKDTKILSLHVWSIGPDGHEYALKDNEIVEYGYPGQGSLFVDDKIKVAKAPGRDPGGIVAYEYEQRIRPYLTEKTWFFQSDLPRLSQSFTLELPPGYTYGTVWAHHEQEKAVDLERQRWRWEMKDTPAIELDHVLMHPARMALSGRMTVHYGAPGAASATQGTWQSIGEWYQTLAKDRLVATPEIAAKAKELADGKADFYDKTEAIAEFVQQQVRYFVIEMGIGGYQPHFAGDIFHNRYGDCKDKATLLSAMLSTVGVHSALVMVDHRRGVVDPDAPSIVGDHMIAAIEIPKGYSSPKLRSVVTAKTGKQYLIFDPTWEKTAFGQLEHNLQGGYGVLMEGSDSQVVKFPLLAPDLNTIRRTASFHLQPDGSVKGTVTEKRFGDLSESHRSLYTGGDAKQQSDYLDHVLEQDFVTFKVSDVKVENAQALNKDLTMSYSLDADRFGKTMGPLLMIRPRLLGSEGLQTEHKIRSVPIDLRETMQAKDDYDIELPPGYAVDEIPEPVKLDLGFAAYESSSHVKDNVLHYTRTYTVREVTLPAERYGDVQKLAGVIAADEQNHAVLKKQ